jgi:hypothetical protein
MEAMDACALDLKELPADAPIIVFPFTNSTVLINHRTLYRGDVPVNKALESRGGTSIIPALDFALQQSDSEIFLIGVDLGAGGSAYARDAKRDLQPLIHERVPAKYNAMRFAIESLLARKGTGRSIAHVLDHGSELRGTSKMQPEMFNSCMRNAIQLPKAYA